MPYTTTTTVKVHDLRVGDLMHMRSGNILPVIKIDRKRTRATVTFDDAGILNDDYMRLDDLVTVDRLELTSEEREEQRIERGLQRVQQIKDDALKQTPADFLAACVQDYPNQPLNSWRMAEYIELQAHYAAWKRIEHIGNSYAELGIEYRDCMLTACADFLLEREYPQNPLSRSTSTISNILDDVDRYAVAKTLDRLISYGYVTTEDLTNAQARTRAAIAAQKTEAAA